MMTVFHGQTTGADLTDDAAVSAEPPQAVVVATPDLAGRLIGRRHSWLHYQETASQSVFTCGVVMGWGVGHELLEGFPTIGWDNGYGDLHLLTDATSLRPLGWQPGVSLAFADVYESSGAAFAPAPRAVLRTQVERAEEMGFTPYVTSELEFYVLSEPLETIAGRGYVGLEPQHATLQPELAEAIERDEPVLAELFSALERTGIAVETAKTEYCPGQYEVTLSPTGAVEMADRHALYKIGTRHVFRAHGLSATFMAKVHEDWSGSSCHLHVSLNSMDGGNLFAEDEQLLRNFGAGLQTFARDFFLLWAPYPNSYKRFQTGTFAPTSLSWGADNRTVAFRVTGHGRSRHIENRIPGGDVNPYLAYAGLLAAGLEGIERNLEPLDDIGQTNAYAQSETTPIPQSLAEAISAFESSAVARKALGDTVVSHIANFSSKELASANRSVTDWDRKRLLAL